MGACCLTHQHDRALRRDRATSALGGDRGSVEATSESSSSLTRKQPTRSGEMVQSGASASWKRVRRRSQRRRPRWPPTRPGWSPDPAAFYPCLQPTRFAEVDKSSLTACALVSISGRSRSRQRGRAKVVQFKAWFDQLPKSQRIMITIAVWAVMFAAGVEIGRALFQVSH